MNFSYFHKLTSRTYLIVGAKLTDLGKTFVVKDRENDAKERMFLLDWAGEFTFDLPRDEGIQLWNELNAVEDKRAKRETNKATQDERKRLARVRRQRDLDEEAEQEALGVERAPWTFEPETDSTDEDDEPSKADVNDEDIVESEIISPLYAAEDSQE